MAAVFSSISPALHQFILRQRMLFVATAPGGNGGHVNVSPKGLDTFRILSPTKVAYLDLTGSGNETAAHVLQNGRITFMFCSFEQKPLILRLYGLARLILPGGDQWDELLTLFPTLPGVRQIILADLHRVQTSCGGGVPLMTFTDERQSMNQWALAKGEQGIKDYHATRNRASIDGLPTGR